MEPNNNPVTGEDVSRLMGILNGFKGQYQQLHDDFTKFGGAQSETTVKLGKLTDDMIALQTKYADEAKKRIDAIEEKLNRAPATPEMPKSIGQQVVENPALLAAIKSGGRFAVSVAVKGPIAAYLALKDITNVSTGISSPLSQMAVGPRLPLGVRSLVPQGRTSAGAVEYVEETSFANNAAVVAEGGPKPKSDKVFTVRSQIVRTIAHYFKASKQTLDDLPYLQTQIENNGIYGVQLVEDNELLNGSGVPPHLQGFMTVAAAAPAPPVPAVGEPAATVIDALGAAVFDLAAKGYMPDGAVLNPADWGSVAMLKSTTGNYLFANPLAYTSGGRVWGARLVLSANQAAGNFLVGAFQGNSQLLDREDVNVQVATQNEDDFIKNMVTILVEERLALVIYQPAAFEKGITPAAVLAQGAEGTRERARK